MSTTSKDKHARVRVTSEGTPRLCFEGFEVWITHENGDGTGRPLVLIETYDAAEQDKHHWPNGVPKVAVLVNDGAVDHLCADEEWRTESAIEEEEAQRERADADARWRCGFCGSEYVGECEKCALSPKAEGA